MKTTNKILALFLILLAFSSCNTGRQYANYRFGGKSKQENKTQAAEMKTEGASALNPEETNVDPLIHMSVTTDSCSIETVSFVETEKPVEKKEIKKQPVQNAERKNTIILNKKYSRIPVLKNTKNRKCIFSHPATKDYGFDGTDLLFVLGCVALLTIGVLALLAAGISLVDIIIWTAGMILFIILLYLLSEAFMNIFPGMSFKK